MTVTVARLWFLKLKTISIVLLVTFYVPACCTTVVACGAFASYTQTRSFMMMETNTNKLQTITNTNGDDDDEQQQKQYIQQITITTQLN